MTEKTCFVYTMKLKTNKVSEDALEHQFKMAQDIYKTTLLEILKRAKKQRKDPLYKKAYKLPKGRERNSILKELDDKYDLKGKFTFGKFAADYRKARNYDKYIGNDVATKLGIRAWDAYSKVKFAKGASRVNINEPITSFEAKSNTNITISNKKAKISTRQNKLEIPIEYKNDSYETQVFENKIKYCRIVRKKEFGKNAYYIQAIVDGIPPMESIDAPNEPVGIDIGTSTVATSTVYQTELRELAPGIDRQDARIKRLRRKLDRQRRANNPENYNSDGTIRRGCKQWHDSNNYLKTKNTIAEILRKQTEHRKIQHKTLANEILKMGTHFIVEQMSFKGLQARTKETKVSETTGRYQSKKRFGKALLHRAPALLISQIEYKAHYQGKLFTKADTFSVKASQLDHTTGEYTKVGLNVRAKKIDGQLVQRDLYSAFILQHVGLDGKTVNLDACNADFDYFLRNQNTTMYELETRLSSTGRKIFENE